MANKTHIGTQNIGPMYYFTKEGSLAEGAGRVLEMGSAVYKFSLDTSCYPELKHLPLAPLEALKNPHYKKVFGLPLKYYIMWAHGSMDFVKQKAYELSEADISLIYGEMYAMAKYLLENYSGTGKVFLLGNWEGDWLLKGRVGFHNEQVPLHYCKAYEKVYAARQKAVERARKDVKHNNVWVGHYVEVNLPLGAKDLGVNRLTNRVLPEIETDMVSYSCYDSLKSRRLLEMLEFIEQNANFTGYFDGIFDKKVFVGEFDAYNDYFVSGACGEYEQVENVKYVIDTAKEYGAPFCLYWELYNNHECGAFYLYDKNNRPNKVCGYLTKLLESES